MNYRFFKIIILIIFSSIFLTNCSKILDRKPLNSITGEQLKHSYSIATAFLDTIYYDLMPCMPYGTGNPGAGGKAYNNWIGNASWLTNYKLINNANENGTDEAIPFWRNTDKYLMGTASRDWLENFDNSGNYAAENWAVGTYNSIRSCNQLLGIMNNADFDLKDINHIKGQAFFFRAWGYNKLVKDVGGVPLVLEAQQPTNEIKTLQSPRNKTSECVAQIISDLDSAIALLPDKWTGPDVGRIDKGVAMAFKGRILLFFASPLFNGLNGIASWQKAYDANVAAKNFLDANGKGLYEKFGSIWTDRLNKEIIMVRRFHNPEATYPVPGFIPLRYLHSDDLVCDAPSLELVKAFPKNDGSELNPATLSTGTYFQNRDDRFYATIQYNGAPIKLNPSFNEYYWSYLINPTFTAGGGVTGSWNNVTPPGWAGDGWFTEFNNFFIRIKAVDLAAPSLNVAGMDWPEIRYAEVLMNLGEAANEIGNSSVALNVLYQIRERAHAGTAVNNFGITATSQSDIRIAYQKERFVEFAFENRRWDDLRRWKLFSQLRGKPRHGLAVTLKPGQSEPGPLDDINKVYSKFNYTILTVEDAANMVLPDNFYIYALPFSFLSRNPNLEQNKSWGGTFDPLL